MDHCSYSDSKPNMILIEHQRVHCFPYHSKEALGPHMKSITF